MNEDVNSSNLKKDEMSPSPMTSDVKELIVKEISSESLNIMSSCSTNAEISNALAIEPENHSEVIKTYVVSKRYKITLQQARRMAINAAKRVQK